MQDQNSVRVEVSFGELVDKITILTIKSERIGDKDKLKNINLELDSLNAVRVSTILPSKELDHLVTRLKTINESLWEIEDEIRVCEMEKDFGTRFIDLSRSVYKTNDKRSDIKRQINELLGSRIIEEKSYQHYD